MPLVDVVVDTDVLMHSGNRENSEYEPSKRLVATLRTTKTALCFDEGFDVEEARNRSAILGEYFERLPHGSLALVLVQECALEGRIRVVPTSVPPQTVKAINRLIWDKSDRKFVKVAINSDERVLVSHNTSNFEPAAAELRDSFGVELLDAYGCCKRL